ncbi:MAG: protein kinase [Planctomycetota bacterium]|nr:protein kinase [Planctomycetota bacterium]
MAGPTDPTLPQDPSKRPGSGAQDGLAPTLVSAGTHYSVQVQDLTTDELLAEVKRIDFEGRPTPALGGIPLLAKLGQGGMGAVYFGVKPMLKQEVAVKVLPAALAKQHKILVDRFLREAQIASRVESPHLVRVTDVNEEGGLYFLVMEYVNGTSAGDFRRSLTGQMMDEPTALDIAIGATTGLAAAHAEGVIHRDIKPDNIMVPRMRGTDKLQFANAKLADLGLARAEDSQSGPTLTGQQSSMGTPGYMAPEQALNARKAGKPADVFSMGATLYALLGGSSPFKGETTTETIYATLQKPHQPLREIRPDVSRVTSELLDKCLDKDPTKRFVDASALLQALKLCRANAAAPEDSQLQAIQTLENLQKASEVGLAVRPTDSGSGATPPPGSKPGVPTGPGLPASSPGQPAPKRGAGVLVAVVVVLLVGVAAWNFFGEKHDNGSDAKRSGGGAPAAPAKIKVGIAYGFEKEEWMKWLCEKFAQTPAGTQYELEPMRMPAVDAMNAILAKDERVHVWFPGNCADQELVNSRWKAQNGGKSLFAFVGDDVVLSPMVFVMFKDRHEAFKAKYGEVGFETLHKAAAAGGGWKEIAAKEDWGAFTFAIPSPAHHASGQAALMLMAHAFKKVKDRPLTLEDVASEEFQAWAKAFAPMLRNRALGVGVLKDMILRGPSAYDGVFENESQVISTIADAEGRGRELVVSYPEINMWNDNPFYILEVPWSAPAQREGAKAFYDFVMGEEAQKQAVLLGMHPGNLKVGMLGEGSPFKKYASMGIKFDVPITVDPPGPEVIESLLESSKRWEAQPEKAPK